MLMVLGYLRISGALRHDDRFEAQRAGPAALHYG